MQDEKTPEGKYVLDGFTLVLQLCECISSSLLRIHFCLPSVLSSLAIFNSSGCFLVMGGKKKKKESLC